MATHKPTERCSVEGCDRTFKGRGFCEMHLRRSRKGQPLTNETLRVKRVCTVEGCDDYRKGQGLCSKHYARVRSSGTTDLIVESVEERFWKHVDKTETCWNWAGTENGRGYGFFWDGNKYVQVHRYAYQKLKGVIPNGLQVDHLCFNKLCINPAHLEAVTPRENLRRAQIHHGVGCAVTHCPAGHEYTPENTYVEPKGSRSCRECRRERTRQWRAEKANQ